MAKLDTDTVGKLWASDANTVGRLTSCVFPYIYIYIYIYGWYIGSLGLQIVIGSPNQPPHSTHHRADTRVGGGPLRDPINQTYKIVGQTTDKNFYRDNV